MINTFVKKSLGLPPNNQNSFISLKSVFSPVESSIMARIFPPLRKILEQLSFQRIITLPFELGISLHQLTLTIIKGILEIIISGETG